MNQEAAAETINDNSNNNDNHDADSFGNASSIHLLSLDSSSNSSSNSSTRRIFHHAEYPNLYFRSIQPADREQIKALHEEWFPVKYQDDFYDALVQGHLHAAAEEHSSNSSNSNHENDEECSDGDNNSDDTATYSSSHGLQHQQQEEQPSRRRHRRQRQRQRSQQQQQRQPQLRPLYTYLALTKSNYNTTKETSTEEDEEDLSRMEEARSSSSANHQNNNNNNSCDDDDDDDRIVACIVGTFVERGILSAELRHLLAPDGARHHSLFYIMTLGTALDYRQTGLATFLVQHCISTQIVGRKSCGTLYLHVLDTNTPAIRFYERGGFDQVKLIPNYYCIHGKLRHCYLYAKYFHGNRGHLSLLALLQRALVVVWRQFTFSARSLPWSTTTSNNNSQQQQQQQQRLMEQPHQQSETGRSSV